MVSGFLGRSLVAADDEFDLAGRSDLPGWLSLASLFFKKIPPNLAVLLMKEILHQLRLVVYPGWLFGVSEPSIVFQHLKHEPFSWISFDSLSLP